MEIGVVIPVGPGREENLRQVLGCLERQSEVPRAIVVVRDGPDAPEPDGHVADVVVHAPKHEPGMEQPRNIGVRALDGLATHVAFLDSDVIVEPDWLEELYYAVEQGPHEDRIVVAPYEWMPPGQRHPMHALFNDPRWEQIRANPPDRAITGDLSAGLACFSGNLLWPVSEFERVGGYWQELHHGRCEDGELGLRAVAMDVPISFAAEARGWHVYHDVDLDRVFRINARDVPLINERHPWVQEGGVFVAERDGARFEVRCPRCGEVMFTNAWWAHATACGVSTEISIQR